MKLRNTLVLMIGFWAAGLAMGAGTANYTSQPPISTNQDNAPGLRSESVLVVDQETGTPLLEKNPTMQTPIASITKLMTAVITLDSRTPLDERLTISKLDVDNLKHTRSRLAVGSTYTREQLLNLALIASENRAAHALGRTYPGGLEKFVEAMNRKARVLGMTNTFYVEPTGLSSSNQSTAEDLAKLVNYAYNNYPALREITSTGEYSLGKQRVVVRSKSKKRRHASRRVYYRDVAFNNTNRLTRDDDWQIGLSKTGFINEAGHCLVMQAEIAQRKVIIVLLDSLGKYSRIGDANRIKRWLEESDLDDQPSTPPTPISRGT
jgi:D-alanyl-D-alanine endopeptidase (penicillin-binding protein 7)